MGRPRCQETDGILGVANNLKMTIDMDNFKTLNGEDQKRILKDPLRQRLEIEVCAPIVYEDEVYGMIALGGIPKYSKQEKKILVNMISNLTASSMVNSMLFSQYKHKATRDALTDLTNKGAFLKKIEEAVVKAEHDKELFSVFMFDIDHFKNYNDTNGHQAGDEALKITAKLIKESFRSGDVLARYGGEEFIVLMKGATKEQAYASAERFRAKVEKYPYPHEKNQPKGILTISGGVATYPDDGKSSKEVIEEADKALYQAKESDRNKVGKAQSIDFSYDGLDLQEEDASRLQRQR